MQDSAADASAYTAIAPATELSAPVLGGRWARARHPAVLLAVLVCGYIGVYLCRKNLSVAVPLLQKEWGVTKQEIGWIASISTVAYAFGKVVLCPLVDRFGGRASLLASMSLVALFGALGGIVPGLGALTLAYSANRLAGSASWGAMVKMVPTWFSARRLPLALGVLSCSYVFGGALATGFAGLVARWSNDNWRMVLAMPSVVLLGLLAVAALVLPRGPCRGTQPGARTAASSTAEPRPLPGVWAGHRAIFLNRQFQVIICLSFTLTFVREAFNFWTIDFFRSEGGPGVSSSLAALLATPFDLFGSVGILCLGYWSGNLSRKARAWVLSADLLLLAAVLALLPLLAHSNLWAASAAIGLIGILVYGPYSLLAGVLAVEIRGECGAATVSGLVDGMGYVAGVLSGALFGRALMWGGYGFGFRVMAVLAVVSAFLCLLLPSKPTGRTDGADQI